MEIEEKVLLNAMSCDDKQTNSKDELYNYIYFALPNVNDRNFIKRLIKKIIFKSVSWYINPIIKQQEKFNLMCAERLSKTKL